MSVFRVEKNKNYTTMSNYHLRDKGLSLKAKGLLSLMLSLPEDWDYTLSGLAYICKDGIDSVRAGVSELEKAYYLTKSRVRNEKGQLAETEYTIFEMPQPKLEKPKLEKPILDMPILESPILDKPMLDNPMQLNTDKLIKEKQRTDFTNQPIYQSSKMDEMDADTYRSIVHKNIDYGPMSILWTQKVEHFLSA